MTLAASTHARQLVTRHVLFLQSEDAPGLPALAGADMTVAPGVIALRCSGSEMTAALTLERHDVAPAPPDAPWRVLGEAVWSLPSGRVGLLCMEGLIEWLPDVGLRDGLWRVRISSAGSEEAQALEDEMFDGEGADVFGDMVDGPERWLVQVWR